MEKHPRVSEWCMLCVREGADEGQTVYRPRARKGVEEDATRKKKTVRERVALLGV